MVVMPKFAGQERNMAPETGWQAGVNRLSYLKLKAVVSRIAGFTFATPFGNSDNDLLNLPGIYYLVKYWFATDEVDYERCLEVTSKCIACPEIYSTTSVNNIKERVLVSFIVDA